MVVSTVEHNCSVMIKHEAFKTLFTELEQFYSYKHWMQMLTFYCKDVYKVVILLICPRSSCLSLWKSSQIIAQDFTAKLVSWNFCTEQKTWISIQPCNCISFIELFISFKNIVSNYQPCLLNSIITSLA